jgi:hypothetical protein
MAADVIVQVVVFVITVGRSPCGGAVEPPLRKAAWTLNETLYTPLPTDSGNLKRKKITIFKINVANSKTLTIFAKNFKTNKY